MYDRRVNNWIQNDAFLFDASFDDGLKTEVQVNSEFGSAGAAMVEATKYALEIGRIPTVLRSDMQSMWIHKGTKPFGGGNQNVLIHTGQAASYIADGILEETLVHEASHTSLDAGNATSNGWLAAQAADPDFISTYARDYPTREDIAESFLTYLAVRHRSDRISPYLKTLIEQTIPNRIAYFDGLQLNMYPIAISTGLEDVDSELPVGFDLNQNHPNPFQGSTTISFDILQPSTVSLRISNMLGKEVITLLNEHREVGSFQVEWDGLDQHGNGVPSGTYLYRLESGQQLHTKTMVVIN